MGGKEWDKGFFVFADKVDIFTVDTFNILPVLL